ncbi:MAG: hypothetical protein M1834_003580 [Cirrosporium novae-zelandiae]|nr:MAG: hypothetical protein M1834_003580 [Cirrosporium novae-zelandiae]
MGWFWGSSSSSDQNDPTKNLDPSLKEFLEKESPSNTPPPKPSKTTEPPSPYRDQILPPTPAPTSAPHDPSSTAPSVPPQSQFPDGRYAHLWKTYKPLADIEASSKTNQDKLLDVLEGYKGRRAEIGRAALENCALEQSAVSDCFMNGGWKSRMTMCRAENRSFERCYMMQSKFLKALGYLSMSNSPEQNERIQMHADTLYHRMIDQEKATEEAKAAGLPTPSFPPIISPSSSQTNSTSPSPSQTPTQDLPPSPPPSASLPEEMKAQLTTPLESLSPEERVLEEAAIKAQLQAELDVHKKLGKYYENARRTTEQRQERLRKKFGDQVASWLGGWW